MLAAKIQHVRAAAGWPTRRTGSPVTAVWQAPRRMPRRSTACPTTARSAGGGGGTSPPSLAVGHHWSKEVLGVVIVDNGSRSLEGDALLLDFAAAYRQEHGRKVVAVANAATLEQALRGCMAEGANKVMVVAYLLSQGRQEAEDALPAALLAAQLKLPGLRCIVGESIPVASILAQHIENQVKAVEVKAPDMAPERYWTPPGLPASANPEAGSSSSSSGRPGTATGSTPALDTSVRQQAPRRGAQQQQRQARSPSPAPQRQRQQQQQQQQGYSQRGQVAAGRAGGPGTPGAPTVWSDDNALLLLDYRPQPAAANSSASSSAVSSSGSGGSSSGGLRRAASFAAPAAAAAAAAASAVGTPPASPPAAPLEQRLASLEHKLETITDLLTERLTSPAPPGATALEGGWQQPPSNPRAAAAAGYGSSSSSSVGGGGNCGGNWGGSTLPSGSSSRNGSSSRARPARTQIVGSSFAASAAEQAPQAAAAHQAAAGGGYEYVTPEEQGLLTADQCSFLERKRRAAARNS